MKVAERTLWAWFLILLELSSFALATSARIHVRFLSNFSHIYSLFSPSTIQAARVDDAAFAFAASGAAGGVAGDHEGEAAPRARKAKRSSESPAAKERKKKKSEIFSSFFFFSL